MVFERFVTWLKHASGHERVLATRALAAAYLRSGLDGAEGEIADAVMTALADDPAVEVRQALAETLASHPAAPRHVIVSLAADVPQVACIVLSRSPLFVDGELIDMVAGGIVEQQIAIALRPAVSPALAAALCEVGEAEACQGLLSNTNANVPPAALHRIAERFGSHETLRRLLVRHPGLPPQTRILLIERLGEAMARSVPADAALPAARVADLVRDNCDRAIIACAARVSEAELPHIVEAIIARGGMTAAFLLRAVCIGNISLFSNGLARLANVSLARVEAAICDDRRTAFRALYRKAGMPDAAFGVFAAAIASWRRLLALPQSHDEARLPYLVTREVLAGYDAGPGARADAELDTLLVLLRKLAAEASRQNARREIVRLSEQDRQAPVLALPAPDSVPAEPASEIHEDEKENGIMEMPDDVIAEFALHFAEEIVDLEEEMSGFSAPRTQPALDVEGMWDDDDDLSAVLAEDEIIAAINFDEFAVTAMPDGAANDDSGVPAVRAVEPGMTLAGRALSSRELAEAARTHAGRSAAA